MEKKLEATLQKALDRLLQNTLENTYFRVMSDAFLGNVKSTRDFLFGVAVGDMFEGLGLCVYGAHKRYPRDQEFEELLTMIHGRAREIRGRIGQIMANRR